MKIVQYNEDGRSPVTIEYIDYIPGLGYCLDIRFVFNDREQKVLIPLNRIRKIVPHTGDKAWTRIYWDGDISNGYCAIPLLYEDVVGYLKTLIITEDDIEE